MHLRILGTSVSIGVGPVVVCGGVCVHVCAGPGTSLHGQGGARHIRAAVAGPRRPFGKRTRGTIAKDPFLYLCPESPPIGIHMDA